MIDDNFTSEFRCQACNRVQRPRKIFKCEGVCPSCHADKWRIHVDVFDKRETTAGSVGLNVLGLGLLATTGQGFYAKGSENQKVNSLDFYEVTAEEMLNICSPPSNTWVNLTQFIKRKVSTQYENHKARMQNQGAQNCDQCGVLFVPATEKPWTMMGNCSKACCAAKHGTTQYNEIEHLVQEATSEIAPKLDEFKRDGEKIEVRCDCGHSFVLDRMYCGVYRKCPSCQRKVLVPTD